MKRDLKDCTFIVPIRIESNDRLRNVITVLCYIASNFDTFEFLKKHRDDGIRCNAICPGFVKTDHGLREIDQLDNLGQDWNEKDLKSVQGRICDPKEVSTAVLYLASDDSSFVNGNAFYIDNGWYAKG